jgi:hypothetical protein
MNIDWKNHFIELLIVIIGISVAFWLNNLATINNEKKLEQIFIADLKADLLRDSTTLANNVRFNERKVEILLNGIQLMISDTEHKYSDSLVNILGAIGNYDFFVSESFTLVSLLQSGDIKLISSDKLKKELLRLLKIYELIDRNQNNLLQALDNNYFPMILSKMDMLTQQPTDPDFFYGLEVKNYAAYTMNDTNNINYEYKRAIKQVSKILQMMDD